MEGQHSHGYTVRCFTCSRTVITHGLVLKLHRSVYTDLKSPIIDIQCRSCVLVDNALNNYCTVDKILSRTVSLYKQQFDVVITGLAVALTCYISHSAKHKKMADFYPAGSQNPLTNFDKTSHG